MRLSYLFMCAVLVLPGMGSAFEFSVSGATTPEIESTVSDASLLAQLNAEGDDNTQDIVAAARADYQRVVGALYSLGYFGPTVSITLDGREASAVSPLSAPSSVETVSIKVNAGPIFHFGRANITPLAPKTQIPETFRSGELAQISAIRSASDAAISAWRDAGHAKAELGAQQITAQHPQEQLNVDLQLEQGPRLTFGRLIVKGNEAVRTERIHDIAGLPEGTVFSPAELRRAATRLRRTGTFRVAALAEAETYNPDLSLDIEAQITENPPRRFGFGADISTQEGLGLSAYWLHRNLFGGAERLRVDAEYSGIGGDTGGEDFLIGVRFDRPATFNEDTDFYALAEIESLDEENFSTDQANIEIGIRRYASEKREYNFGIGLRTADTSDAFGDRSYTLLTLPLSASFDDRDNQIDTKDGTFISASVTPFVGLRGSDDGARIFIDTRGFKSFGTDDRFTFAIRGQLGSLYGASLSDAPTDFLFYSGGSDTVRGQEYQELGVELSNGREVGGRSFLGLSSEVRVKTTESLSVVGFYDVGYIGSEEFPNGSDGTWHSGAGLGLRYNTGIGPIRLDLGVPVTGPGDQSGFEVYIGIGQAF
ncbi:MAG: BamA/TamA family outer membrane protein [Litoreibacter sp.]